MKFKQLLILFFFQCSLACFGQEIKYIESGDKAKEIEYVGPSDKAVLIFQTELDLTFEASNDSLSTISRSNGKYKVPIDIGSQIVTIKSTCCGRIMLNFIYGDLGTLKSKDVRYFVIEKANIFGEVVDVTKAEKAKGISDFPGYNDKDGFLFFYTTAIPKIDIQFKEKNGYITKTLKETDRYQLYAKSGVPIELTISANGYDDLKYSIDTLGVKGVKYFRIFSLNNYEKSTSSDNLLKKGSYKIITDPVGAVIEIDGNPYFNKQPQSERKTPKIIEENAGLRKITISLDKYETVIDTINIGGAQNISEYKLIPLFSNIRFYITPANAEVYIDDQKIYYTSGADVEVKKGVRFVEIKAAHYYPQSFNIQTYPNQTQKINKTLAPIMGSLTITSGDNANGADVLIDGKSIGKVPLTNYPLQEGNYLVQIKKNGFASKDEDYKVTVSENKTTSMNIEMVSSMEVSIKSLPDGADVSIDGQTFGRTNLKTKLGIGRHNVIITKEYYETQNASIDVTDNMNGNIYLYNLKAKKLSVVFFTKPEGVSVMGDGVNLTISGHIGYADLSLGKHKVTYSRKGYFDKGKIINVSDVGKTFTAKLFPTSFGLLGFSYGLGMPSINLSGCIKKHFFIGAGFGLNLKTERFPSVINVNNANVDDIGSYTSVGKIKADDSVAMCMNLKIGWLIQKPIYFMVNIGYAGIEGRKYQNVYKAHHDYMSADGSATIKKDEYFTSPQVIEKGYNAFTVGLIFPIARRFYIGADFYTASGAGMGLVYHAGIILY